MKYYKITQGGVVFPGLCPSIYIHPSLKIFTTKRIHYLKHLKTTDNIDKPVHLKHHSCIKGNWVVMLRLYILIPPFLIQLYNVILTLQLDQFFGDHVNDTGGFITKQECWHNKTVIWLLIFRMVT